MHKAKHYKNKKETDKEIKERILKLAEPGDYGIFPPPMDAQVALDELAKFFLGDDWYTITTNTKQINTEIVYEIESKYKKVNRKR